MNSSRDSAGSYVLILRLPMATSLEVGRLGLREFSPGYYAYVGSAMGGLKRRLRRYVSARRTTRWHVDYLTELAAIGTIAVFEARQRLECRIAEALTCEFSSVKGFGCSDCACPSHLFFSTTEADMIAGVGKVGRMIGVRPVVLSGDGIGRHLGSP